MAKNITQFIDEPVNPYFNLTIENGKYFSTNKESYYLKQLPDQSFSFDVTNNKVTSSIDEFGTIKSISFYHGNYLTEDKPGVWVSKDFVQENDLSFKIRYDDKLYDFKNSKNRVEADLVFNLFPRIKHDLKDLKCTIIVYAPVGRTGARLSCLVYGIYIENLKPTNLTGELILPKLYEKKYSDRRNILMHCPQSTDKKTVHFSISPGKAKFIPFILCDPNAYKDLDKAENANGEYGIYETYLYYKERFGTLSIKHDPMTAYLLQRALYQSLGALTMNSKDEIVGANWGTTPVTNRIWNKDMYYAYLPFSIFEPHLYKKGILWFLQYGIKFPGSKFRGGLFHSLSNSLSSIMMAGMYFEATGDRTFFLEHPEVYPKMLNILEEILNSRQASEPYLFHSLWLSDAYSLGKYHLGTNICVWRGCQSLSTIAAFVYHDMEKANELKNIANFIKEDIEKYMTIDGTHGKQYLEGIGGLTNDTKTVYPLQPYQDDITKQGLIFLTDVIENGSINLVMHDGEETDTTLMPYYGYKSYSDPILRNYIAFSMSHENPTYNPENKGIKWGNESGATFPGYITAMLGITDEESMNGEEGYLRELKRLADLDGSWWWWPYQLNRKRGDVVRMNSCGKCSWASGTFATLFVTQILGIQYNAPAKTLYFRPFSPSGSFKWENLMYGYSKFDLSFEKDEEVSIRITNKNEDLVEAFVEIITEKKPYDQTKKMLLPFQESSFLNQKTVLVKVKIPPHETFEMITKD